jgi:hypothetical protein
MIDAPTATWLVSGSGLAAVDRATAALDAGEVDDATVVALVRHDVADPTLASAVVDAAIARRRARRRWTDADRLLFTRESLAQATDPAVSAWKARRFTDRPVADVTAGVGGDATALAREALSVHARETRAGRGVLLGHNARARGVTIEVAEVDAMAPGLATEVLVHADPDRRRDGRRRSRPEEGTPALSALSAHFSAQDGLAVALSPGVDVDDPLVRQAEIEFIQVDRELKSAMLWSRGLRRDGASATATLLPAGESRGRAGPARPPLAVGAVGEVLLLPEASLVRARLHDEVAAELGPGVWRLDAHRALFGSAHPTPPSPWFRARAVVAVLSTRPRAVRSWLTTRADAPIEVAVHGLPLDPEEWWRQAGRPPRGPNGLRVDLVRLEAGSRAIVSTALADGDAVVEGA